VRRAIGPAKQHASKSVWGSAQRGGPPLQPVGGPLSLLPRGAFPVSTERDANWAAPQPRSKQGSSAGERKVRVGGREAANRTEESNQEPSHLQVLMEAWARRIYTEQKRSSSPAKGPSPCASAGRGQATPGTNAIQAKTPVVHNTTQNRARSSRTPYFLRRREEVRATSFYCCNADS